MNINSRNISKAEEALELALSSSIEFGLLFLPNDFRLDTVSSYHYEMAYLKDNKYDLRPKIFMIPRGHGKTKITQASILKEIVTYNYDDALKPWFIVWVATNKTQSMRNVNFIKNQIETNEQIKYYFGDLSGDKKSGKKWTQEELDFTNGCSMICRAGLHGIRGLLKDHLRPNRFVLDDFEDEANTKTKHSRDMNANAVTSVIMPALDPEVGRLEINQTPVHYDCFVQRVYDELNEYIKNGGNEKDFSWVIYRRATKIENPLWKEYFDEKKLRTRKRQLEQAGQLHTWYQEYEMQITSDETSLFGKKVLKFWDGHLEVENNESILVIKMLNNVILENPIRKRVLTFLGCDPASDIETRTSSDMALNVIAVDEEGYIYVLYTFNAKNVPDIALKDDPRQYGTANMILNKALEYNCRRCGVEKTALSSGVFNSIRYLKDIDSKYSNVVVTALSHESTSKIDRIYNGLIKEFNMGMIYIKPEHSRLETEIITFGEYAKYIDLLDSLEMSKRVSYKPSKQIIVKKEKILDPWEQVKYYNTTSTADNWKTQ